MSTATPVECDLMTARGCSSETPAPIFDDGIYAVISNAASKAGVT